MSGRRTSKLKRRRYQREPKRRFVIYCEGEKTEPDYFAAVRNLFSDALIEIETKAPAGVPYTLATAAVERARSLGLARRSRKALNSFEKKDEVWAVFDRDEHPRFADAVTLCENAGVSVGRSNPCFEVWLILHDEDYDKPDGRRAVQAHLKRIRPEYDNKGAKTADCSDLVERLEEAERRAEAQLTRRRNERTPYGPPSTTVGHLTAAIQLAAETAGSPEW